MRRRSYANKTLVYKINIDKSMCPNPVSIVADGEYILTNVDGNYYEIKVRNPIRKLSVSGSYVSRPSITSEYPEFVRADGAINGEIVYYYNSGTYCNLASFIYMGYRQSSYTPRLNYNNPDPDNIYFTYEERETLVNVTAKPLSWTGSFVYSSSCIRTDICRRCVDVATAYSPLGTLTVFIRIEPDPYNN